MKTENALKNEPLTSVENLAADRAEEVVDVLVDSFDRYPVMRHIIGSAGADYDRELRLLMGFFAEARFCRGEPVLGVCDEGRAVAVALLTSPDQPDPPPTLAEFREKVWKELGEEARSRYEAMGNIWQEFTVADPHYHLNMIGVKKSQGGRGLARKLLDAVHELSGAESGSTGVSLTTEDSGNVPLYEHFGYRVIGHIRLSTALETWGMFRATP